MSEYSLFSLILLRLGSIVTEECTAHCTVEESQEFLNFYPLVLTDFCFTA